MSKLSRAVKFVLFIWVVAISFAIPQALPLKLTGRCPLCLPTEPVMDHSFEISTFVFFLAPMTLITVLYILIGSTLRTSRMMKTRSANYRAHSKSSKKVVKMLVAVVVAFFICWAPFHVQRLYSIYATFPKPDEKTHSLYLHIYELVTYISGVLYYVSATTNPILYSIMSVKFREAFKETFARCCGLGLQRSKPQRHYSTLLKNGRNGNESTDSARDDTGHTNTTLTHKNSNDSFGGSVRFKFSFRHSCKTDSGHPSHKSAHIPTPIVAATIMSPGQNETKFHKLTQYFECLKSTSKGGKKLSTNESQTGLDNQNDDRACNSCDISNSSLKDIEKGAIEDELGAYINELRSRKI